MTSNHRCSLLLLSLLASDCSGQGSARSPFNMAPKTVAEPEAVPERSVSAPRGPPAEPWVKTAPPPPLTHVKDAPDAELPTATQFRLTNGLRVIVVPHERRPVVTTRLYFGQGALDDPEGSRGATFIAVALLGEIYEVDARGRRRLSEDSLRRKLFESGAFYSFQVFHDDAYIAIDGYAADLDDHLAELTKAVARPRRSPSYFSAYRSQLVHMNEEIEPEDAQTFRALLTRAAFGPGHPYASAPFGVLEDLKELGLRTVENRQDELLEPRGSTLLVVGDTAPLQVRRLAERTLGQWKNRGKRGRSRRIRPARPPRRGDAVHIPLAPASLITACSARPLGDLRASPEALDLLVRILGHGFSGRLHRALRELTGLSYSSGAQLVEMRQSRTLIACTQVDRTQGATALRILRDTIGGMRTTLPTETELARAKAIVRGELEAHQDDMNRSLMAWHQAMISQSTVEPNRIASVEAVTLEEIHRLARAAMNEQRWRIVLTGKPRFTRAAARGSGFRLRPFLAAR